MASHRFTAWVLLAFTGGAIAGDITIEVHDAGGKPVAGSVIYAERADGNTPPNTVARAVIDQINKEFVPRVSVVQAGTSVHFPNSDNIRHSIYSFSPAKTFSTKLYSGREAAPVLFDNTGVVVLGCNIHDNMVAWVYIVDTPWFAVSGDDGIGTLRGLPDGDYRLTFAAPETGAPPHVTELRVTGHAPQRQTLQLPARP